MATLITFDGKTKEIFPKDKEKGFSLEELYKLIGCEIIQHLNIGEDIRTKRLLADLEAEDATQMIIDEEGKLKDDADEKYNLVATTIWAETHGTSNLHLRATNDHVVGNVILCSPTEFQ